MLSNDLNLTLILDYIGAYAPIFLLLTSIFLLQSKINYLKIYIFGILFNNIFNLVLKNAIKEPRPSSSSRILEIAVANKKLIDYDKFGMPSGHAQTCGFELAFITMVFNNSFITGSYIVVTMLSLFQRYKYSNHTILQLVVGLFIGIGVGYLFYVIGKNYIKGNIKMKPDDDAFR
jgi:membrane-associated phospholipid phosphatase